MKKKEVREEIEREMRKGSAEEVDKGIISEKMNKTISEEMTEESLFRGPGFLEGAIFIQMGLSLLLIFLGWSCGNKLMSIVGFTLGGIFMLGFIFTLYSMIYLEVRERSKQK